MAQAHLGPSSKTMSWGPREVLGCSSVLRPSRAQSHPLGPCLGPRNPPPQPHQLWEPYGPARSLGAGGWAEQRGAENNP